LQPHYWEPVFAISNEREFSGRTLWAIENAFTENHPVRVFGNGLTKAMCAEVYNLRRWFGNG
jgi:hypothetical protein